jgi:hypothetical protein
VKATPLGVKTVDCLACIPVKITKDMVGQTIGVFVAIETKRTGISKPTDAQGNILQEIMNTGGGTALVHSTDELEIEGRLVDVITKAKALSWVTIGKKK